MINFDFDHDCCGCTSCANSCPKNAISMARNEEGFLMPSIDIGKCVECGICEKSCPHINTSKDLSNFSLDSFKGKGAYIYYSVSDKRKESASGGFVYDAMNKVVSEGGIACGCLWDENLSAVHCLSDRYEDLLKMQSSKYVQSNLGNSFKKIKAELKNGRRVIFCGTPCQSAGLKQFVGNLDTTNLINISLICHGVPSPSVWDKWKCIMEKKYNGKLVDVNMRDKSYKGYSTSYSKYTFVGNDDQEQVIVGMPTYLADPYIFLFTDNLYLRHSCNHCQYKADNNGADIIVGDFHASIKEAGNMGCSTLIAMNVKGQSFISDLGGVLKNSSYDQVCRVNSMLWKSVDEHPKRDEFFSRLVASKLDDITLFTDYLPFRFKVKRFLNRVGVFSFLHDLKTFIKL